MPTLDSDAVDKIIKTLPQVRSSDFRLRASLHKTIARFQRYLRQEHFGPTRADQIAMLTLLISRLEVISGQLTALSIDDKTLLEPSLTRELETAATTGQFFDALESCVSFLGLLRKRDCLAFKQITDNCELFLDFPARIDTNTGSLLFQEFPGIMAFKAGDCLTMSNIIAWIDGLKAKFEECRAKLRKKRGFDASDALGYAVWSLASIWRFETGQPVTHHSIRGNEYLSASQTPAGQFVTFAIMAMLPPLDCLEPTLRAQLNVQNCLFADERAHLRSRIARTVKLHVQKEVRPEKRGRKKQTRLSRLISSAHRGAIHDE